MKFDGRHAAGTGGTGALGAAVVGAPVQAGTACTVPWLHDAPWASVHIVAGVAMAPLAKTGKP